MNRLSSVSLGRYNILTGDKAQLLYQIRTWLKAPEAEEDSLNRNYLVGFVNPYVFNFSCQDYEVEQFLATADAVCIDGVGIKLAVGVKLGGWKPRVVAEHLFNAFLSSLDFSLDAILIGGEPGEAEVAVSQLERTNNNLCVTATKDGYENLDSYNSFLLDNRDTPLVLIGAGTPKSERIALLAKNICTRAVIIHIGGGTLNTYSGKKQRGPLWLSKFGMEWMHRCLYEPSTRHRYTSGGILFLKNFFL